MNEYFLKPDELHLNEYYLKYKILELMTDVGGLGLGYAFKSEIQNSYFWPNEMGDFTAMIRGLKDVISIVEILSFTGCFK